MSFEEMVKNIKYNKVYKPVAENVKYYKQKYQVFRKIYPALKNSLYVCNEKGKLKM